MDDGGTTFNELIKPDDQLKLTEEVTILIIYHYVIFKKKQFLFGYY